MQNGYVKIMDEDRREAADRLKRLDTCTRCGQYNPGQVQERYSFGIYAGRMCEKCCLSYRDHCGIDQDQGDPADLDEQIDENY